MKTRHLLLACILLTLTSCSNTQDLETKFYKITPGMTKPKVLSTVGKPKYVGQEQSREGVVEVWHYPYPKSLKRGNVGGVAGSMLGPHRSKKPLTRTNSNLSAITQRRAISFLRMELS